MLNALLLNRRMALSALARECGGSERFVRRGGWSAGGDRTGWIRAILERYAAIGVAVERRTGSGIVYELNEASPAVALLRELRLIPDAGPRRV